MTTHDTTAADAALLGQRHEQLRAILRECGSVCVGYSGGVDSVFLAATAVATLGHDNVLAVTGRSAAYPMVQRDVALECAIAFDIPHLEIETDELADERYTANPSNRCYFCKSELWPKLIGVARERGLRAVLDGSNADDAGDYRPGFKAAREHGVRSPMLEAGLTKANVRALSRQMGLPTWDQPAAPCLSSRLPYGIAVTPARLREVEHAEAALRALGFRILRVRHHDDCLRIELAPHDIDRALHIAADIRDRIAPAGRPRVLIDVEGYRRGALNEVLVTLGAAPAVGSRMVGADGNGVAGRRDLDAGTAGSVARSAIDEAPIAVSAAAAVINGSAARRVSAPAAAIDGSAAGRVSAPAAVIDGNAAAAESAGAAHRDTPPHEAAGFHGDIAVVGGADVAAARRAAGVLRARGFRYIALDTAAFGAVLAQPDES